MFCSPTSSKSDILNRKYENNDYIDMIQNSCGSSTKYPNNHDQRKGQDAFKISKNFDVGNQFDMKLQKKNNNKPEFEIFTDVKPHIEIRNSVSNDNENKNINENYYVNRNKRTKERETKDNDEEDNIYSNRLSLEMDNMNNITSRKGSIDSLSSESLNFAWVEENVHTLGASTSELSVIKEVSAILNFT